MSLHESTTDRALLRSFSERGSHEAFVTLVKRHGAMVHAVSRRILSNHHDAEDVTQAVFVKLAREAGRLGGRTSVAGWLHTVSRRLSLNARKSRESRLKREEAVMNTANHASPESSLSAGFRRELDAALGRLPEHYRQPLVLFHLEGASLKETAERLELHPNTLRTRLSRAREMLRRILAKRGVEITSVGLLSTLLAAEAKAATLPAALLGHLIETARGGADPTPHILELARKGSVSFSIPVTTVLMKSKVAAVSAIVLILAAIGGGAFLVKNRLQAGNPVSPDPAAMSPAPRPAKVALRQQPDPLSRISTLEEFHALVDAVMLIGDDASRRAAIREQLGMDLPEAVYQAAVRAHGYQIDPRGLYLRLLEGWSEADPEAVARWANRFSGELRETLLTERLARWLTIDDPAAKAWAEENTIPAGCLSDARSMAEQWRRKQDSLPRLPRSSDEAAALLKSLREEIRDLYAAGPDSREQRIRRTGQLCTLIERWAEQDAAAAVAFAYSLDSSTRNVLGRTLDFRALIRKWASRDPDAALKWAKEVGHPEERLEALADVLPSWQLKHPDQGIDDAVDIEEIPEGRYERLIASLVSDWAVSNPSAAVDYAMRLEEADLRSRMVSQAVESWTRKDPGAARDWSIAQPAGEVRNQSLTTVAEHIARTDFNAAGQLVLEIDDPGARDHAIHRMMTGGTGIRNHFPDALRLADLGMSELSFVDLRSWAHEVRPDDIPEFRDWLERSRDAGRIQWHPRRQQKAVEPAKGWQFILQGLRPEQE